MLDAAGPVASKESLPGVRLVRAFNAINAGPLSRREKRNGERVGIPLASDDRQALEIASMLVSDAGFDAVIVGDLSRAREFDYGTPGCTRLLTAKELRKELKLAE